MGCGASIQASTDAALLQWNQPDASSEVKQRAMTRLKNNAERGGPANRSAMFTTPGVVEAFIDASKNGQTSQIKLDGTKGLYALARAGRSSFFDVPGVLQTLMAAAHGDTDHIKIEGLRGLAVYAMLAQDKSTVIEYPGYLDTLVGAIRGDGADEVRIMALAGLMIPASWTTSKKMCESPTLVETLVEAAKSTNKDIKSAAFSAIWNLADHPQAADLFVSKTDLLELLQQNTDDSTHLPNIYLNLSMGPKTRPKLAENEQVLKTLQDYSKMTEKRPSIVAKLALTILKSSDPRYLIVDPLFLAAMVEILAGAIKNVSVLEVIWPLIQPLLALQALTTIPENRRMLGVQWLKLIPVAVEVALTRNVVEPILCAQAALSIVAQYAADARSIAGFTDNDKFLAATKKLIDQRQHDAEWGAVVGSARSLMITPEARGEVKGGELPSQTRTVPPRLGRSEALIPVAAYAVPIVVPDNADDLKAWGIASGISEDVIEAMIREGYVNAEMLRELAKQSVAELKSVLGLEQAAKASKLHKELIAVIAH